MWNLIDNISNEKVFARVVCKEIIMAANVQQWPVMTFRICYVNCMANVTLVGGGGGGGRLVQLLKADTLLQT